MHHSLMVVGEVPLSGVAAFGCDGANDQDRSCLVQCNALMPTLARQRIDRLDTRGALNELPSGTARQCPEGDGMESTQQIVFSRKHVWRRRANQTDR